MDAVPDVKHSHKSVSEQGNTVTLGLLEATATEEVCRNTGTFFV